MPYADQDAGNEARRARYKAKAEELDRCAEIVAPLLVRGLGVLTDEERATYLADPRYARAFARYNAKPRSWNDLTLPKGRKLDQLRWKLLVNAICECAEAGLELGLEMEIPEVSQ